LHAVLQSIKGATPLTLSERDVKRFLNHHFT